MAKEKQPKSVKVLALRPFRALPHNEDDCISVPTGGVVELEYENHIHVVGLGKATKDKELVKAALAGENVLDLPEDQLKKLDESGNPAAVPSRSKPAAKKAPAKKAAAKK